MSKNFIEKIKGIDKGGDQRKSIAFSDPLKSTKIVKEVESLEKEPEIILLSNLFNDDLFKDPRNIMYMPIESFKIILLVIAQVKQFNYNQNYAPYTPSLFDEEFMSEDNSYIKITLPNKLISPSRESKRIIPAFDALIESTVKLVKSTNARGEELKSRISFVERPNYTRGKVQFEVSSYWVNRIANISFYNKIVYQLVNNVTHVRQLLFALWLKTIPKFNENTMGSYKSWTVISAETLHDRYAFGEKCDANYITEKFLKPLQMKLFDFNDISFAFKYFNGLYYITSVDSKSNFAIENLSSKEKTDHQIKYFVDYLKRRHKLTEDSCKYMRMQLKNTRDRELVETAYKSLKKTLRVKKIKMTELIGKDFLTELQQEIIIEYQKTSSFLNFPEGYPRV